MKKFIMGLALLSSISTFASMNIVEGTYSNRIKGCELTVKTGDYFRTNVNRLIVEMDITKITPYGAILTQDLDFSIEQIENTGMVELDNAAGMGSYVVARVSFNKSGTVNSFMAQKASPRGDAISEIIKCENMSLNLE